MRGSRRPSLGGSSPSSGGAVACSAIQNSRIFRCTVPSPSASAGSVTVTHVWAAVAVCLRLFRTTCTVIIIAMKMLAQDKPNRIPENTQYGIAHGPLAENSRASRVDATAQADDIAICSRLGCIVMQPAYDLDDSIRRFHLIAPLYLLESGRAQVIIGEFPANPQGDRLNARHAYRHH